MPHRIESPFSFRLAEKITGVPGGTVPFRYGEAKGIFSFEKRISPGSLKRNVGDIPHGKAVISLPSGFPEGIF